MNPLLFILLQGLVVGLCVTLLGLWLAAIRNPRVALKQFGGSRRLSVAAPVERVFPKAMFPTLDGRWRLVVVEFDRRTCIWALGGSAFSFGHFGVCRFEVDGSDANASVVTLDVVSRLPLPSVDHAAREQFSLLVIANMCAAGLPVALSMPAPVE